MIAKITRGSSFKGAARYVLDERRGLDPDRQPEIIAGNMAGRTSSQLAREFEIVRQQRPDIRKPVEHVALSFARSDRPLDNEDMARLADEYVRRRGYDPDRCQYVVVRHHDKEHQHCHILLNRVRTDRTVVPQQFREDLRNKETCRGLERDYGLRPIRNERRPEAPDERAPKRGEDRMRRDRGAESEKEQLKVLIREEAAGRPTMRDFVRRLEARGVQVRANIARTGHVSGISYRLDHVAVKGSGLGRTFSFEGLQRQLGVQYEPSRDLPELERAGRATRGHEPAWVRDRGVGSRLGGRIGRRVASRIPDSGKSARSSLARDLKQLTKSPSRAAVNIASRALPPQARLSLLIARRLMNPSRTR